MKRKRMIYAVSGFVILVIVGYGAWRATSRDAYESAEYEVVVSDRPFEIRAYPDLTMATTPMQIESQEADGSFSRLFQYISGANTDEQKIAMTTPVFMESDVEKKSGQMGFVIPKAVAGQSIPEPSNQNVQLRKREGGRFAVIRFSGRSDAPAIDAAKSRLRAWMAEKGLTGEDQAERAGYDPPWTPGPWRRNEVLIRLMPATPSPRFPVP